MGRAIICDESAPRSDAASEIARLSMSKRCFSDEGALRVLGVGLIFSLMRGTSVPHKEDAMPQYLPLDSS